MEVCYWSHWLRACTSWVFLTQTVFLERLVDPAALFCSHIYILEHSFHAASSKDVVWHHQAIGGDNIPEWHKCRFQHQRHWSSKKHLLPTRYDATHLIHLFIFERNEDRTLFQMPFHHELSLNPSFPTSDNLPVVIREIRVFNQIVIYTCIENTNKKL